MYPVIMHYAIKTHPIIVPHTDKISGEKDTNEKLVVTL